LSLPAASGKPVEAREEAAAWIADHGGPEGLARSAVSWLEGNQRDSEADSEALERWAASERAPDRVRAMIAGVVDQLLFERREAARGNPVPTAPAKPR
jgi:hypothetical protein